MGNWYRLLSTAAAALAQWFACGMEFWSFLERVAQLADTPFFRRLRRCLRRRFGPPDDRLA